MYMYIFVSLCVWFQSLSHNHLTPDMQFLCYLEPLLLKRFHTHY